MPPACASTVSSACSTVRPRSRSDFSLGHPGGSTPGVGFASRPGPPAAVDLDRLDPAVVVAHGSEPLKYLVAAMVGRRRPLVYYAIGTYSGSDRRIQLGLWRRLSGRADVVAAEGEEVLDECVDRFGVPPVAGRAGPERS